MVICLFIFMGVCRNVSDYQGHWWRKGRLATRRVKFVPAEHLKSRSIHLGLYKDNKPGHEWKVTTGSITRSEITGSSTHTGQTATCSEQPFATKKLKVAERQGKTHNNYSIEHEFKKRVGTFEEFSDISAHVLHFDASN